MSDANSAPSVLNDERLAILAVNPTEANNALGKEVRAMALELQRRRSDPIRAELLPCDVLIAPVTIIRKGAKLSTLLLALEQREKQPSIEPLEAYGWNRRVGNDA